MTEAEMRALYPSHANPWQVSTVDTNKVRRALQALAGDRYTMPQRERRILEMRARNLSRPIIADMLNMTPQRVRQLEGDAHTRVEQLTRDTPQGFYAYERFGP